MLELAILGLLKENELHGYELKKRLTDALGPFSSVSFGSLYPCLARLERAGAVKAVEALPGRPTALIPMTGSIAGEAAAFLARRQALRPGGRSRKVYGITDQGEQLFADLLAAESVGGDDERAFNLKLAFARYLPREARLRLFERRRTQLVDRLARVRNSGRGRHDRMDRYTRSLYEHGAESTERDISWLDALIASERQTAKPEEGP